MKFFIDTANLSEIEKAHSLGIISGVTTNPTLVVKEGVKFEDRIKDICKIVKGSVSAEVMAEDAEGMYKEGLELSKIASNVTIKVPMTVEGLKAVSMLSKKKIETNVTLIFSANQALLAARAGATYVSPFLGRLDDIGQDGVELVADIKAIFNKHDIKTNIIAASVRHPEHVRKSALAGADICTLPYKVIEQMMQHPLTDIGIEKFNEDWKNAQNK